MNAVELKNFVRETLIALRTINQEIVVFDAVIDFITQSLSSGIPDWTNALTFNTDGSGAGTFCTEPDTNGAIRFWKTKTDGNVGNQPPTNPLITENAHWIEVSPSDGSAIKEWSAGVYGVGLIIVYHNHSVHGRGQYILLEPVRPFNSTNIETEITAGKWARFVNKLSQVLAAGNDAGGLQIKNVADPTLPQDVDTQAARDLAIANAIAAIGRLVGGWASASLPTTGFGGGSISAGDYWKITGTITIAGIGALKAGDTLVASIDNAAVAADFFALQSNVDQATSAVLGLVKLYTDLAANNTDGSPTQAAVNTGLGLKVNSSDIADQTAAETVSDGTLGNRNNTKWFTARSFRWAWDKMLTVATVFTSSLKAKQIAGDYGVLTDAANIAWDANAIGNIGQVTLGGNRTLNAITNPQIGAIYILRVVQDGTGGRTLAFNAAFTFPNGIAPVLNTAVSAVTVFQFFYDGTNFRYILNNGALRVTDILVNNQIQSGKKVGLYIDTDGTIKKVAEAEYDSTLKKWVYTGSDTSSSTISAKWQNSALEMMFELYNDKVAKFGGDSAILEVNAGVESGNATLRFLSYPTGAGLGFRFQDDLLNDYINLRSLTTDKGVVIRQPAEYNYGVGEVVFTRQIKLTLPNTTASANHVIFEYALAEEEHYEIKVDKAEAIALNTDGSKSITSSFGIIDTADVRRITAGSIEGNTIVSDQSRLPSTVQTGGFNWVIDTGTNKIQYCFRNGASPDNETYDVFVHISIVKRLTPVDA